MKGMCLRPWLSESQGDIRIQCFLEERGKGGDASNDRPIRESFKRMWLQPCLWCHNTPGLQQQQQQEDR